MIGYWREVMGRIFERSDDRILEKMMGRILDRSDG